MDYRAQLRAIQGQVKKQMANYTPGGFSVVPDDTYQARVRAVVETTKTPPQRLKVSWGFTVAEGDFSGRQVWDGTIIQDNETGLSICRGRVEVFGYEWPEDDLALLADICEQITAAAPLVTIKLKNVEKDGYNNPRIRITEVLETIDVPEQQPADDAQPEQAPEEAAPETPADAGVPDAQALLDFCAAQGIDGVTSDMSSDDIITALKDNKFTFNRTELTEEEAALLTALDAAELIIEPEPVKPRKTLAKAAPAPAPATRTAAPTPSAKTTRVQPKAAPKPAAKVAPSKKR